MEQPLSVFETMIGKNDSFLSTTRSVSSTLKLSQTSHLACLDHSGPSRHRDLPCVWATSASITDGTALWHYYHPVPAITPPQTSTNTHLQSLHRLPGIIYLLPSVILAPWLPSKLLLKHISSIPFTHYATDGHPSAPPIHSSVTYGAN